MSWRRYLRKAVTLPPHQTAQKACRLVFRNIRRIRERQRDHQFSTFNSNVDTARPLNRLISAPLPIDLLNPRANLLLELADRYLRHEFDLLGSGRVQVKHGMICAGFDGRSFSPTSIETDAKGGWLEGLINQANISGAKAVYALIDQPYTPVDWQLDFKSGYRWSESTWAIDVKSGGEGSDIKLPWELSRMQHLPQLAQAYALDGNDSYRREYRNQVLDFIATNPPRFGVNWTCTMDVGIRVANILVAYDLFASVGVEWDEPFRKCLHQSIHEHGAHIVSHLEWDQNIRGNHYLANIAGFVLAAAYLPASAITDEWLAFAVSELVQETKLQFGDDGANFEASTLYHRLSAEMVVYATAITLAVDPKRRERMRETIKSHPRYHPDPQPDHAWSDPNGMIPSQHFQRIARMAGFTRSISRADGQVPQIGDSDSGRFMKIDPAIVRVNDELVEDHLDHSHLNAVIASMCESPAPVEFEPALIRALVSKHGAAGVADLIEPVDSFPDFGLYVYRAGPFQMWIRCGDVGQNGNGGHSHNDQLSFELAVGGVPVLVDPGTYVYTPSQDQRNRFRSVQMHNTLCVGNVEPNQWDSGRDGLFTLIDRAKPVVIESTSQRFIGEHHGFAKPFRRELTINAETIRGTDQIDLPGEKQVVFNASPLVTSIDADGPRAQITWPDGRITITADDGIFHVDQGAYSRAYGYVEPALRCALHFTQTTMNWSIDT